MSRIHLRSNTLVLWLSLSVAVAASALGVGCSSSSDTGGQAGETSAAGKSAGGAGKGSAAGGETGSDGGDPGTSDGGDPGDSGGGTPSGGKPGTAGGPTMSDGGDPGSGDAGAPPMMMEDPDAAAKARALATIANLAPTKRCTYCHQLSYSGANGGYYPNITPDDDTGIGLWEDVDIKNAITKGIGIDDHPFCNEMEQFDFTDQQIKDLIVFLRGLTPVHRKITKACVNP